MADCIRKIIVDVEVPPLRIPYPPDSVSAVKTGSNGDLSWVDNDTVATHYEMQASNFYNFSDDPAIVTLTANPGSGGINTFSGLSTTTPSYFRIRSKNGSGASAWITVSA